MYVDLSIATYFLVKYGFISTVGIRHGAVAKHGGGLELLWVISDKLCDSSKQKTQCVLSYLGIFF